MKNTEISALFNTIADSFYALSAIYSSATEDAPQPKATTKKEKPAKVSEPESATDIQAETKTEVKTYTKEEVRVMLSQKAQVDGCKYKSEVKSLIAQYSEDGTLSKVPEDKYSELIAKLEMIGNA